MLLNRLERSGLQRAEIASTRRRMGHDGVRQTEPRVAGPVRCSCKCDAHPGFIENLLQQYDDVGCERRRVQQLLRFHDLAPKATPASAILALKRGQAASVMYPTKPPFAPLAPPFFAPVRLHAS